ncbi:MULTISPECIES: hypothetical protein [Streptomyces]|uniref:Uncharacterized protein n=1 Tax=Streptomyces tsukubensis (strain DSM 42081 / NBRC 108919 / NRRL 18488 / 9993) TaxID=1114943 RepID=A0A7G3U6M7_STRT9|nr:MULTISPECIES: hypothetical protein [Streptomyces]AZK98002.1 hypothetical protein B7R87_32015 [Streptomyces tsukubensis]MYS64412.1 hypothetical protein [Streptomyces sp. SID5473]QKM66074.1 hypothetical protein STSU_001765 [Streptomyces tsukubensis NRRL18488]TAI42355.1 hypothetical protein EWI31_22505 [Streptomyces tsukubensis]
MHGSPRPCCPWAVWRSRASTGTPSSGGFFVHLAVGTEGRSPPGTHLTRAGALLVAAALVALGIGLIQSL